MQRNERSKHFVYYRRYSPRQMLELLSEAAIEVAVAGVVEEHSEFLRGGYGTATVEAIPLLEG